MKSKKRLPSLGATHAKGARQKAYSTLFQNLEINTSVNSAKHRMIFRQEIAFFIKTLAKKRPASYSDTTAVQKTFISKYNSSIVSIEEKDQFRPIHDNDLSRQKIFDTLLLELGFKIFLFIYGRHRLTRKRFIIITVNGNPQKREIDKGLLKICSSLNATFEVIEALTSVCAYCFSNFKECPTYLETSHKHQEFLNVVQNLREIKLSDESLADYSNFSDLLNSTTSAAESILNYTDKKSGWKKEAEEAIDCCLRFYLSSKEKENPRDTAPMQQFIWDSIAILKSMGHYPFQNRRTIKDILRDKAYFHSQRTGYKGYTWGTYKFRKRKEKKNLKSNPEGDAKTIDLSLPSGKVNFRRSM